MRVLLDTNVVISSILFGGHPRRILEASIEGRFDLVTSPALLEELERLLSRKFGFSSKTAAGVRSELEQLGSLVEPAQAPRVARDRDDDQVLAAAVEGRAEIIVTGDADLLVLEQHRGIRIVAPQDFELPGT
ncbi:MAG: putative toxin-antitoxin system toxin component, PIN family [Actinomycetota bacterium]